MGTKDVAGYSRPTANLAMGFTPPVQPNTVPNVTLAITPATLAKLAALYQMFILTAQNEAWAMALAALPSPPAIPQYILGCEVEISSLTPNHNGWTFGILECLANIAFKPDAWWHIGFSTATAAAAVGAASVPIADPNQFQVLNMTTLTASYASGTSTIGCAKIRALDFGRPVTGAGIPAGSFVGAVTVQVTDGSGNITTPGSFTLSSTQGSTTAATTTAAGTSVVLGYLNATSTPGIGFVDVFSSAGVFKGMFGYGAVVGNTLVGVFPTGYSAIGGTPSLTTVAAGSNNVNTNTFTGAGVLNVASTGALPIAAAGTVQVATAGTTATITYTGYTGTTLTGCTTTAGGGVLATGGAVTGAFDDLMGGAYNPGQQLPSGIASGDILWCRATSQNGSGGSLHGGGNIPEPRSATYAAWAARSLAYYQATVVGATSFTSLFLDNFDTDSARFPGIADPVRPVGTTVGGIFTPTDWTQAQAGYRIVTDAVISGGTTLTSATAAFTAADTGRLIDGPNLPTFGTLMTYVNATTVTLATAGTNGSGLTASIGSITLAEYTASYAQLMTSYVSIAPNKRVIINGTSYGEPFGGSTGTSPTTTYISVLQQYAAAGMIGVFIEPGGGFGGKYSAPGWFTIAQAQACASIYDAMAAVGVGVIGVTQTQSSNYNTAMAEGRDDTAYAMHLIMWQHNNYYLPPVNGASAITYHSDNPHTAPVQQAIGRPKAARVEGTVSGGYQYFRQFDYGTVTVVFPTAQGQATVTYTRTLP